MILSFLIEIRLNESYVFCVPSSIVYRKCLTSLVHIEYLQMGRGESN